MLNRSSGSAAGDSFNSQAGSATYQSDNATIRASIPDIVMSTFGKVQSQSGASTSSWRVFVLTGSHISLVRRILTATRVSPRYSKHVNGVNSACCQPLFDGSVHVTTGLHEQR